MRSAVRGMTIVELMVSMTVILLLTAAAGAAYLKLIRASKTQSMISDTYLEKVCGLELLRYDIEMAGYGLPHNLNGNTYSEAASVSVVPNPASFNDAPDGIPRAFALADNNGTNQSDVLVIKSVVASVSRTSSKWSVLYFDGVNSKIRQWQNPASAQFDFASGDRFIIQDESNRFLQPASGTWSFTFSTSYWTNADALPHPTSDAKLYIVYGISTGSLSMPFNRVDYHLGRPTGTFPSRCAPSSYILYRSTINQSDGRRNEQPLLDCVLDFQVAFGLDTDGDRAIDTWQSQLSLTDTDASGSIADEIREQVREVRVFILYQEGECEDTYFFDDNLTLGDGNTTTLSTFVPGGNPAERCNNTFNYRWKVAKLAVKPVNLE